MKTISLNSKFTFDDFVAGPSNRLALSAALDVSQSPGKVHNPLYLYGETGNGCTHLMQAIGHKVLESSRKSVFFVPAESFDNHLADFRRTGTTDEFRSTYRKADLLMVDDIQYFIGKNRSQEELLFVLNQLYDDGRQIVVTGHRHPNEFKEHLNPGFASLLQKGAAVELTTSEFETRLAILRHKQSLSGMTLSEDVLRFIAENITSCVRALEGAFCRCISWKKINPQEELTVEKARILLKDYIN